VLLTGLFQLHKHKTNRGVWRGRRRKRRRRRNRRSRRSLRRRRKRRRRRRRRSRRRRRRRRRRRINRSRSIRRRRRRRRRTEISERIFVKIVLYMQILQSCYNIRRCVIEESMFDFRYRPCSTFLQTARERPWHCKAPSSVGNAGIFREDKPTVAWSSLTFPINWRC
jgi:hypothetical protein